METYLNYAINLRQRLHQIPEESMKEMKTRALLMEEVKRVTGLEPADQGNWFYAKYQGTSGKTIVFRADYDAVMGADGKCHHVCGHDGHAATLVTFAKWVVDHKPDNNIIFLFQPGEESGEGAAVCCDIFELEQIDEIYGYHNIPRQPLGKVLIRHGTFACASVGLEIRLKGSPAHAAYPETGNNPADSIGGILDEIREYVNESHKGIVLATVVGIQMGSDKYGMAASEGTIRLTVRAEYGTEFEEALTTIRKIVDRHASEKGYEYQIEEHERFPSTENHEESVKKLESLDVETKNLETPFRWSEDFGWYLKQVKGAIFGVGAGEDAAELHTREYQFQDEVMEYALKSFIELSK